MSDLAIISGWPIPNKPWLNYFTAGKKKKRAVEIIPSGHMVSMNSASSGLIAAADAVEKAARTHG